MTSILRLFVLTILLCSSLITAPHAWALEESNKAASVLLLGILGAKLSHASAPANDVSKTGIQAESIFEEPIAELYPLNSADSETRWNTLITILNKGTTGMLGNWNSELYKDTSGSVQLLRSGQHELTNQLCHEASIQTQQAGKRVENLKATFCWDTQVKTWIPASVSYVQFK